MSSSFPYRCRLLKGDEVLDGGCLCTFARILRESPFGGEFAGEGSVQLSKPWSYTLREKEPRQFTLRFDRVVIPGVGELEEIPIVLVPDDLFGSTTAVFKIGKV